MDKLEAPAITTFPCTNTRPLSTLGRVITVYAGLLLQCSLCWVLELSLLTANTHPPHCLCSPHCQIHQLSWLQAVYHCIDQLWRDHLTAKFHLACPLLTSEEACWLSGLMRRSRRQNSCISSMLPRLEVERRKCGGRGQQDSTEASKCRA